jgi:capsular polysaccharide biosynthesis protein
MDPYADDATKPGSGFDPLQLLRIFKRRKMLFIVPFVLCLAMAMVAIKVLPPIYYSSGQIRVVHEMTTARVLPRDVPRYGRRNLDQEAFINIQTIVTGPKFLERVAQEIGLISPSVVITQETSEVGNPVEGQADDASLVRLARRLGGMIRVKQDGPTLFSIGVRHPDPEQAYQIARVVLERFIEEERASRVQPSTSTLTFLENQRQGIQQDRAAAERKLTDFQRSMLTASLAGNPITEANLSVAEATSSRLRSQFYNADTAELYTLERRAQSVLQELPPVTTFSQDAEIAAASRELADLEYQQILRTLERTADASAQNTLGALRLRLNSAVETKTARDYPQLGALDRSKISQYFYRSLYHEANRRVLARLEQNIKEFRDFMTRQPEQSATLSRLTQEVERTRGMLATIEQDIAEENLRVEASLSEIGYKIVVRQDPELPLYPIEPDKKKLAFMGFLMALALGLGLVILVEMLDRSFKSVSEIEEMLRLPVIGTMPVVESEYFKRQRTRHIWIWLLLVVTVLLIAGGGMLVIYPRLS